MLRTTWCWQRRTFLTAYRGKIQARELPARWRETPAPPELAQIGDEFVKKAETCLLLVPSALAVNENNWLINPQHPEFKQIAVNPPEPLRYDPRMFRRSRRARPKHVKVVLGPVIEVLWFFSICSRDRTRILDYERTLSSEAADR